MSSQYRPGASHRNKRSAHGDSRRNTSAPPKEMIPIPQGTKAHHKNFKVTHPGLLLDKLVPSVCGEIDNLSLLEKGWQEMQKNHLEKLAQSFHQQKGVKSQWKNYAERVKMLWQNSGAMAFSMKNTAPVITHISRDSALENAGMCLHPIYGVPILPGSGLKGVARSWAQQQGESQEAIRRIFGAHDDLSQSRGTVCFFDAIPEIIPRLEVDIVNNHHGKYYGNPAENQPGDWEDPVPVYFLAVSPGAEFTFAVSGPQQDVEMALKYLQSGLRYLGVGAKTNAGYGFFELENTDLPTPTFTKSSVHELELVSPAFFAGALQQKADCRLRSATLRGLLRTWWRMLHTNHLSSKDVGGLEQAIFGSAEQAGALQIQLSPVALADPLLYSQKDMVDVLEGTKDAQEPDGKTTFGLYYLSYGMDTRKRDKKTQKEKGKTRFYLPPGATWRLELSARDVKLGHYHLSADDVLQQAQSALWLLCHYGGAGAKSRKGFGSFKGLPGTLEDALHKAHALRQKLALHSKSRSPLALSADLKLNDLWFETDWTEPFFVVHKLGEAFQAFAKKYKRQPIKQALGFRNNIKPCYEEKIRASRLHQVVKSRHSSPIHVHLELLPESKTYAVRLAFFVAGALPNHQESEAFLSEFRDFLKEEFGRRLSQKEPPSLKSQMMKMIESKKAESKMDAPQHKVKDKVQIRLMSQNKKGTWKGIHEDSGYEGSVVNSKEVPEAWSEGQSVEVEIASINATDREMSFRWVKS